MSTSTPAGADSVTTAAAPHGRTTGAVWTALALVYVVWGSTYLGIRIVVETMPPFLSAGARFITAGLLLAAVVAWRHGTAALRATRAQLGSAVLVGLLLVLGGNGLVVLAETSVPAAWPHCWWRRCPCGWWCSERPPGTGRLPVPSPGCSSASPASRC
ncbi:EamA family transporter [Streptomyces sp. NRRL F-4474]|uniref:EamA family transporter n=1 Tax=Streptomyces sp. NRRL F-4474 TaxID=1463851 RepID=UPI000AD9F94B|nr:EamA family transporter [Streptomyces sp. NRRL F-4474]